MEGEESTSVSTDNSSEAIENYDFSKPDGGLSEVNNSDGATTDDAGQAGNPEDGTNSEDVTDTQDNAEATGETDPSKMSEKERNNYYAQRRIAEKVSAQKDDDAFQADLRSEALEKFIDIEDDEESLNDMDPAVADHIRQLRRNERTREAERAIERIGVNRQNVRLDVSQAETSIPMFNPADPAYNEALHQEALSDWAHRSLIVRPDSKGVPQVIGVRPGAPTAQEYLQERAKTYERVLKDASLKGQRAAQLNQNRADARSTSAVSRSGSNSVTDIESRIGDLPLDRI